ncbi:DUF4399 domain-containing protein [Lacibacterium aquatile]|uniref:DUF4399 domain-containing protein n=1 Tax=Lacibacterium aquatile TaxID=1168082 RepID=A0ABW5DPE6_9PROT
MKAKQFLVVSMLALAPVVSAKAGETPAPAGSSVYLIEPKDGSTVKNPVKIVFGLKGMGVAPALVEWPNTGHHHLLIDVDNFDPNKPLPNNATHLHFGGGETEKIINLPPGKHTIQAVLGDHNHVPHATPVQSEKITITVE